ncbi:MAG TPA: c-type cytochrome [Candidatus Angelobacter sp.]
MRSRTLVLFALALCSMAICACNNAPGRPTKDSEILRPNEVLKFDTLYQQNCAGCHGLQGKGGAAIALNSPVYLEIADDATIRRITAQGVAGTAMPAFAQSSGGMLTDDQINAIVAGIRSKWGQHGAPDVSPPSYAAMGPRNPQHGGNVYGAYCASCHGDAGRGGSHAGSIVDESFLDLVSDRYLRTIVIVGRPEMGAPDWRGNVPGRPMSQQDVSDVVAWLSRQRPKPELSSSAKSPTGGTQ